MGRARDLVGTTSGFASIDPLKPRAYRDQTPKKNRKNRAQLVKPGYLRTLLIHGARAALGRTRGKQDPRSLWLLKMRERRHANVVAVALANKNARIAWGLLASGMNYDQHLTVSSA